MIKSIKIDFPQPYRTTTKKLMKNYVTMDIHWLLANAQISVVMVSSSIYNVMMGI